jgi:hypothetical protein
VNDMSLTPDQTTAIVGAVVTFVTAVAALVNSILNAMRTTQNHQVVLAALEKKTDKPINWKVSP